MRPKPKVILESIKRNETFQVIEAQGFYGIFYDDEQVGTKTIRSSLNKKGVLIKYPRAAYTRMSYAFNLVRKLNKRFKTDKFNVRQMTCSRIIEDVAKRKKKHTKIKLLRRKKVK